MKTDFDKVRVVIGDLADVLDQDFPDYVIEEDKTLQYKQMIVSTQSSSVPSKTTKEEEQAKVRSKEVLPSHPPLPNFSKLIVDAAEAQRITEREKLENEELMEIELKKC
mmetsp:Transcript_15894/g.24491  ORF Transcript_15894/g.24491 Transcript_15894/m.24491 type:complete len:109 (+) Transcript_15894:948-1274(+)